MTRGGGRVEGPEESPGAFFCWALAPACSSSPPISFHRRFAVLQWSTAPSFLSTFLLSCFTFKYSQLPFPPHITAVHHLRIAWSSTLYRTRSTPVSPHEVSTHGYSTVRVFLVYDQAWSRQFPLAHNRSLSTQRCTKAARVPTIYIASPVTSADCVSDAASTILTLNRQASHTN